MPITELISEKEDSTTTKKFYKKTAPHQQTTLQLITDLKPEYDKIMRELEFDHQHCTFYLYY